MAKSCYFTGILRTKEMCKKKECYNFLRVIASKNKAELDDIKFEVLIQLINFKYFMYFLYNPYHRNFNIIFFFYLKNKL